MIVALSATLEFPTFKNRRFVITPYYVIAAPSNFSQGNKI